LTLIKEWPYIHGGDCVTTRKKKIPSRGRASTCHIALGKERKEVNREREKKIKGKESSNVQSRGDHAGS